MQVNTICEEVNIRCMASNITYASQNILSYKTTCIDAKVLNGIIYIYIGYIALAMIPSRCLQDRIITGVQTHEDGFAEWLRQRDQSQMVL